MATLFVKNERGREVRMLQVAVPGRGRKTLRLGPIPARAAERFRDKIEALASYRRLNQTCDPDTQRWLVGLSNDVYTALAGIGLAEPRDLPTAAPTLKAFMAGYVAQKRGAVKSRSVELIEQTEARLLDHFGPNILITKISADVASNWRDAMVGEGLSEATVRLHTRNAKGVFNSAVERDLLPKNPFRHLPSSAVAADHEQYISTEVAEAVIAKLPCHEYRLLFGLARYAGLRVSSETHGLDWANVGLDSGRMTVFAPKTGSTRVVPIVPRLMQLFEDSFAVRKAGAERVIGLSTNNLHRTVIAAIGEAGLERWPDLFQTLRCSAETDFASHFPQHAVSRWMGHGIGVSERHYLQVPGDLYDRASALNPCENAVTGQQRAANALQHGTAQRRTKPLLALASESARAGEVA